MGGLKGGLVLAAKRLGAGSLRERVQERKGGGGVVRSGVEKGKEVDYRLVNLRAFVELDTYQKRSTCGTRVRRRATVQRLTTNGKRLPLPSRTFRMSVGRRRRGRFAWAWVSGADVKLLFGHLSDRRPRRLPVSARAFEATDHDIDFKRGFILFLHKRKAALRVSGDFLEGFLRAVRVRD